VVTGKWLLKNKKLTATLTKPGPFSKLKTIKRAMNSD